MSLVATEEAPTGTTTTAMSAQPTLPPPNYTDAPQPAAAYKGAKPNKSYGTTDGANEPLLNDASGSSRAWMDQAAEDDLPDDFK